jgi:hypothetical protein
VAICSISISPVGFLGTSGALTLSIFIFFISSMFFTSGYISGKCLLFLSLDLFRYSLSLLTSIYIFLFFFASFFFSLLLPDLLPPFPANKKQRVLFRCLLHGVLGFLYEEG